MPDTIKTQMSDMKARQDAILANLFETLSKWCEMSKKPIVLIIDEVDNASNNQVFLDFLSQLRAYYLQRDSRATFKSVILAGVHDVRNLRKKVRPDAQHEHNSPWNIATSFDVDMSFNTDDIAGMLQQYEDEHREDESYEPIQINEIAQMIYDYTSGYPVLVSDFCSHMDDISDWTSKGVLNANRAILMQKNPLFESLIGKLEDDEKLKKLLYGILFCGNKIPYNPDDATVDSAMMYGFVKNENGLVAVANRVFEVRIYNWFISLEMIENKISSEASTEKNQFIEHGHLNMEKVLEKFAVHFNDIYGDKPDKFKEDDGRKLFLLYLRPIINGTGNYYIESQTRDNRRTDIIVDFAGEQYIIELKIWRGEEYNLNGERQIADYLEYYHLDKGYLVSFNFNQKKTTGIHTVMLNGKTVVEAVV